MSKPTISFQTVSNNALKTGWLLNDDAEKLYSNSHSAIVRVNEKYTLDNVLKIIIDALIDPDDAKFSKATITNETVTNSTITNATITKDSIKTSLFLDFATADRVLTTDSSKNVTTSSITTTELGYLSNATSNIQTQLNNLKSEMKEYLPLSGGTLTGDLTGTRYIAKTAFTTTSGKVNSLLAGTSGLFANGLVISNPATNNDQGWIRVTGTGESDTVLEIATGDDGGAGEKIVVRQYNTSNTVTREVTLLGTDGNTSFPNTVTATTFSGSLSGNATSADTATKLGSSTVGSSTTPIYLSSGTATSCSGRTVPGIKTASAITTLGYGTNNGYVPDISMLSYWNGAYSGTSSNLAYCNKGAFGDMATKTASSYALASHTHSYLPLSGGTMTGTINMNIDTTSSNGNGTPSIKFSRTGETYGMTVRKYNGTSDSALIIGDLNESSGTKLSDIYQENNGYTYFTSTSEFRESIILDGSLEFAQQLLSIKWDVDNDKFGMTMYNDRLIIGDITKSTSVGNNETDMTKVFGGNSSHTYITNDATALESFTVGSTLSANSGIITASLHVGSLLIQDSDIKMTDSDSSIYWSNSGGLGIRSYNYSNNNALIIGSLTENEDASSTNPQYTFDDNLGYTYITNDAYALNSFRVLGNFYASSYLFHRGYAQPAIARTTTSSEPTSLAVGDYWDYEY